MNLSIITGAIELGLIYAIMSLGIYVSFRVLNIPDLSVDGSFTLGCCVSAVLCMNGQAALGIIFAFLAGAIAGIVTGFLHTKLKIQVILAGILTMSALYSVNLRIMDGKPNLPLAQYETIFTKITDTPYMSLLLIILLVLITLIILYLFMHSSLGLSIRATGDNEAMVKSSSINTDAMKMIGLAIANALVALSGGILAQYQQFADVSGGIGMMVIGLASIIIGEAVFRNHSLKVSLCSAVFGSVIYRTLLTIALMTWLSPSDLKLFSAVLVVVAISLPSIKETYQKVRKHHA
ncbi:MAG: ABC transporter permease [Erysipelotrichaceae bacterium]